VTHDHGLTVTPEAGRFLRTKSPSYRHDVLRGIWDENPVFRQLLGLCPVLAVSNTEQRWHSLT